MGNCGVEDRLDARTTSPKTEDTIVNPISIAAANPLDSTDVSEFNRPRLLGITCPGVLRMMALIYQVQHAIHSSRAKLIPLRPPFRLHRGNF